MKELSLFSGAGGGLLGTRLLGWDAVTPCCCDDCVLVNRLTNLETILHRNEDKRACTFELSCGVLHDQPLQQALNSQERCFRGSRLYDVSGIHEV